MMTWRVLGDRLPTRKNLQREKVLEFGDELKWMTCRVEDEFTAHLFGECNSVKRCGS